MNELIREVSEDELDGRLAALARELGVSVPAALGQFRRGELVGTRAEVQIRLIQHLRGDAPESVPPLAAE
jgi:hypothetical protein